jgi:radical SAM protein with 4Fe4S-binding SPASM domain
MREVSYGELSQRLHHGVAGRRVPIAASVELTRRCPLRCVHCYNNLALADHDASGNELSTAEHLRVLDELVEAGCSWLHLTGGEVLARADFLDIYLHAKRSGLLVTLFSNGTLVTPQVADVLAEWRPFSVEITLHGATRSTYERVTRVPGSFDRCLRGIRLLAERRLPLKLKTVCLTVNVHEVWDIKRLAEEELGVPFAFDALVNPRLDCSQSPLGVRLLPEQVVALDLADPRRREELRSLGERSMRVFGALEGNRLYRCGAGAHSLAVDPEGRMGLCVLAWPSSPYDLRHGSVREGWERVLGELRQRPATRVTKCSTCHLVGLCGMCPANGELECGDAETPVDFLCRVAHLRAAVVDLEVPAHGACDLCPGGAERRWVEGALARLGAGLGPTPVATQARAAGHWPASPPNRTSNCHVDASQGPGVESAACGTGTGAWGS